MATDHPTIAHTIIHSFLPPSMEAVGNRSCALIQKLALRDTAASAMQHEVLVLNLVIRTLTKSDIQLIDKGLLECVLN